MKICSVQIVAVAGLIASSAFAETPVTLSPSVGQVQHRAHIYFNVATGERVVTRLGEMQTQGADTGSSVPIWAALVQNPCEAFGYTTEYYFGVDNPTPASSLATSVTLLDYGDIATDTVVDCIQVNWVTAHQDVDTDSDSIPDGVEELAAQWMVWDADNGVDNCIRSPLVSVLLYNLPGHMGNVGALSEYTVDIDLVGGFSGSDLSFEIGDSDGDCQTAAFCNSNPFGDGPIANGADRDFDGLPDTDLDGDGLFDWSWTVRFYQPGTGNDFDSDGDTGTPGTSSADTIGVSFGFPTGSAVDNGDGTWTWNIDTMVDDAGTGEEDRFVLFSPPDTGGTINHLGGYWFGGFACTGGLISGGGTGYTPPAMFQFLLYGPDTTINDYCDYNEDGLWNFFDVSQFLQDYLAMHPRADLNDDGMWNFFDASLFLQKYNTGCP